jgi:hypothetical protein
MLDVNNDDVGRGTSLPDSDSSLWSRVGIPFGYANWYQSQDLQIILGGNRAARLDRVAILSMRRKFGSGQVHFPKYDTLIAYVVRPIVERLPAQDTSVMLMAGIQ